MFSERLEFFPLLVNDRDPVLQIVTPGLQLYLSGIKHLAAFPEAMEAIRETLPGIEDGVPSAALHVIRLCDRLWDYKGDPEKFKALEEKLS